MIPQVIGTRSSQETRMGERFLKERRIRYSFVDLDRRALSRGELEAIARFVPAEELLDRTSREFGKKGLAYMDFDILEEIIANQKLLIQPILRHDRGAVAGFDPEKWMIL